PDALAFIPPKTLALWATAVRWSRPTQALHTRFASCANMGGARDTTLIWQAAEIDGSKKCRQPTCGKDSRTWMAGASTGVRLPVAITAPSRVYPCGVLMPWIHHMLAICT